MRGKVRESLMPTISISWGSVRVAERTVFAFLGDNFSVELTCYFCGELYSCLLRHRWKLAVSGD